ncbi:MAG: hypothetical protein ABIL09_16330 [Gemmatimonadota bacterium]
MKALHLGAALLLAACSGDHGTGPDDGLGPDGNPATSPAIQGVPPALVPPQLARDYYPNGLTRQQLLSRLPDAAPRSGHVGADTTWSGVVHLTGDLQIDPGATLSVAAGTWILVAARSDDQARGQLGATDQFNPKDPPSPEAERTELQVQGSLLVQGTPEAPVIITSDAPEPRNDDWSGLLLVPQDGGRVEIIRALIEYGRYIGIGSADVTIAQSILRNMMGCVVIGGSMCDVLERVPLDLTPTLTQNHIYNAGRHAVTIRGGAPTVTHNVIRARPDLETSGWEQGAIGMDVPTCAVIEHNFLDGSPPQLYQGGIFGQYHEYTEPKSAGLAAMCGLTFRYNTLTGSPLALETHAGDWTIEHNNLLPVRATGGAAVADSWQDRSLRGLVARRFEPEPSDACQIAFLEQIGGAPTVDTVRAPDNYWGTADAAAIEQLYWLDGRVPALQYRPFATAFIAEALPDWRQFEW